MEHNALGKNIYFGQILDKQACDFIFPLLIRHFNTDTLFCDCQLKWLLFWARSKSVRIGNDTVCVFPTHLHGLEFRNLRGQQLTCGKHLYCNCRVHS